MSKRSKHKLNRLRRDDPPVIVSTGDGTHSERVDTRLKEADQALKALGEAKVMELSRMLRENPSLGAALSRQERLALYAANQPIDEEQALDYNVKAAEAEAQGHVCSLCGITFEGIGHSAAPFPGRCCKACALNRVAPMRNKRLRNGLDPRGRTAAKDFRASDPRAGMNAWAKPETVTLTGADAEEVARMHPGLKTGDEIVLEKGPNWDLRDRIVPNEARVDRTPGAGKSQASFAGARPPDSQIRLPSMADLVKENLISDIPTTLEKLMTEHFPELMQKYYPRIYENVGRYHSPRQCAAFLANVTCETEVLGYDRAPTAYRLLLPSLEPMARRGMPMFFIAPDLLQAIQRTDFADDIDWTTLRVPYEQGIFMLPKGALVHQDDGDVAMILWARFFKNTDYPAPIRGWPPTSLANTAFVILGLCIKNGIWYDSTFNADHRPTIRLHNLFYREPGERTPASLKSTNLDSDLTDYDEGFLEKLGVITFGTFLAMNAKPELLEKGKLLKRVVKAGAQPREFWSPNIIGPKYRLKREVPRINRYGKLAADQPKRDLGGTHASPRLHWRRGHFRNQPYGVGLKERKQIWIEPMLVGAETEEEARKAGA